MIDDKVKYNNTIKFYKINKHYEKRKINVKFYCKQMYKKSKNSHLNTILLSKLKLQYSKPNRKLPYYTEMLNYSTI